MTKATLAVLTAGTLLTCAAAEPVRHEYKVLATQRTSTMQKELSDAGADGFEYCGQTVFQTGFGGREVAVVLVANADGPVQRIDYRLLATSRTSTMESELQDAADSGYILAGMTVSKTAFGGSELVSIMQRKSE